LNISALNDVFGFPPSLVCHGIMSAESLARMPFVWNYTGLLV